MQTTGLHPSLTALFNELAAALRIPLPIRTGPSGWPWQEAKSAKLRSKVTRNTTAVFPLTGLDSVRSPLGLKPSGVVYSPSGLLTFTWSPS